MVLHANLSGTSSQAHVHYTGLNLRQGEIWGPFQWSQSSKSKIHRMTGWETSWKLFRSVMPDTIAGKEGTAIKLRQWFFCLPFRSPAFALHFLMCMLCLLLRRHTLSAPKCSLVIYSQHSYPWGYRFNFPGNKAFTAVWVYKEQTPTHLQVLPRGWSKIKKKETHSYKQTSPLNIAIW